VLPFMRLFPTILLGLPTASASNAPTNLLEETSVKKIRKSPSKNQKIRKLRDTLRPFLVYIAN
jgi:hypothetical protein